MSNKQSKYKLSKFKLMILLANWSLLLILVTINSWSSLYFIISFLFYHLFMKKIGEGVSTLCKVLWQKISWSVKQIVSVFIVISEWDRLYSVPQHLLRQTHFLNLICKYSSLFWTRAITPRWVSYIHSFSTFSSSHQSYHLQGSLIISFLCINPFNGIF